MQLQLREVQEGKTSIIDELVEFQQAQRKEVHGILYLCEVNNLVFTCLGESRPGNSRLNIEGIDLSIRRLALAASSNNLQFTHWTPTGADGPIKLLNWVIQYRGEWGGNHNIQVQILNLESRINCAIVVCINNKWASLPCIYAALTWNFQCGQNAHAHGQGEPFEVSSTSVEQPSCPTPFVSDRLTQGCVCVCVSVRPALLRGWGTCVDQWSSVTHLSCVWAAWLNILQSFCFKIKNINLLVERSLS